MSLANETVFGVGGGSGIGRASAERPARDAGLKAERQVLERLEQEVALAVRLGEFDLTRQAAERALQGLSTPDGRVEVYIGAEFDPIKPEGIKSS